MITLKTITKRLENELNALGDDEFVIFNDVADFKKGYRQGNDITNYINGIMEALAPTRLPIKNLQVITQSYRVTFALDVALLEKDSNGNYKQVENIRNLLEKYINTNNGKPFYLTDSDNLSFEITPSYSGITVGVVSQMSPIGETLPMYFDFDCVYVQSGVNANSINLTINGENMYFQNYSATRTRTAETNMLANEKSSKTIAQANGLSLNLTMPLLDTAQSKAFEDDVWAGTQNEAICVERYRENATTPSQCYIMTHGNNTESGAVGENIGQTIDLVEGIPDKLKYSDYWANIEIEVEDGEQVTQLMPTGKYYSIIWWGDGKCNYHETGESISHTYEKAGKYTIRRFTKDIKNYTLKFNSDGGTPIPNDKIVTTRQKIGTLPVVAKQGYNFVGWFVDDTEITEDTVWEIGDAVAVAHYEAQVYTLTIEGWQTSEQIEVTYGQPIGELPNIPRPGYSIENYSIDDQEITKDTIYNYTEDKTAIINYVKDFYTLKVSNFNEGILSREVYFYYSLDNGTNWIPITSTGIIKNDFEYGDTIQFAVELAQLTSTGTGTIRSTLLGLRVSATSRNRVISPEITITKSAEDIECIYTDL